MQKQLVNVCKIKIIVNSLVYRKSKSIFKYFNSKEKIIKIKNENVIKKKNKKYLQKKKKKIN